MIPERLQITGFLSYSDPVDLDFSSFDLACISGSNGSGKSSLLDAITWTLFGQARRRDDAVINNHSTAAEVAFDFLYEGCRYRVQRSKSRDRSAVLEFYLQDEDETWRPLTEHTLRDTEERIRNILRMDYETFINASFFLQGKADQFAQQRPGERKRILSNVLGLEAWQSYQEKTMERRKQKENELSTVDGQLTEIDAELEQEEARRSHLQLLERELENLVELCQSRERELESLRLLEANLTGQKKLVDLQADQLQVARKRLEERQNDLQNRQEETGAFQERISSATEIETGYKHWLEARKDLEAWDARSANFHQYETRRAGPLMAVESERLRIEQEQKNLLEQKRLIEEQAEALPALETDIEKVQTALAACLEQSDRRADLENNITGLKEEIAALKSENQGLGEEGKTLNERIARLEEAAGASCPLCGQSLTAEDRDRLVVELTSRRDDLRSRYQSNLDQIRADEDALKQAAGERAGLSTVENRLRQIQRDLDQLSVRRDQAAAAQEAWRSEGVNRLAEVEKRLAGADYAPEARALLDEINLSLKALGYDAAAHDAARQLEQQQRIFEEQYRQLERARAALEPLERVVAELKTQIEEDRGEVLKLESTWQEARKQYEADAASLPDVHRVEAEFYEIKERENRLRMEVGGALQKVEVLHVQRTRRAELVVRREDIVANIGQLKMLERAFSKDGVPALLIEQSLPQIEIQANEILDRLTAGAMSVRFATQKDYKDKNREDKKETLDIIIGDAAGEREYEMFSGGEAFRVNFAIRLALSRVLAQRAGARLQTLVIDEGFGSQDSEGRQRLVEAINLVQNDFAKVLVITHLEELKDAFPARIEVEKTLRGSIVKVVA